MTLFFNSRRLITFRLSYLLQMQLKLLFPPKQLDYKIRSLLFSTCLN